MQRNGIFPVLGLGVLLALTQPEARTESAAAESRLGSSAERSRGAQTSAVNLARSLLQSGRVTQARQLIRSEIEIDHGDASLFCVLGDILFRLADFEGSAQAYAEARSLDPGAARAYWGLSRVAQVQFRRERARDLIAEAFRLDPRDPDIVLSYADFVSDAPARAVLLQNAIALTRNSSVRRAADLLAQLQIDNYLAGDGARRLSSPYTRYVLKLAHFNMDLAAPDGLLITAVMNGKPLRLLLDTGAKGILIDSKAARSLALEDITASGIGGIGGAGAANGRVALARAVSFGELNFRDCIVEVSDKRLTPGADGVVGLTMFDRFEIRVDPRRPALELEPLPEQAASGLSDDASRAFYAIRHLILVKAKVDGRKKGLFLVDTGSAVTSISGDMLPALAESPIIPIQGPCGSSIHGRRLPPVAFEFAGRTFVEPAPLAVDLTAVSQQEGVQISGILGYPLLRNSTITINYRDGVLILANAH